MTDEMIPAEVRVSKGVDRVVTTADRNVTTEDELWRQYGHPLDIHREVIALRTEVAELTDAVEVIARQLAELLAIVRTENTP